MRYRTPAYPWRTLPLILAILVCGCSSQYFRDAPAPPDPVRHSLDDWPSPEVWTGIVFNGSKIGFTHLKLERDGEGNPVLHSEAALRFRFLTMDKQVKLIARDRLHPDLTLRDFEYEYHLDGNRMQLSGEVTAGMLQVRIRTAAGVTEQEFQLQQDLYPAAAINMVPVLRGLARGRQHDFQVYDGETQQLATVQQEIAGYEFSDLFEGGAYRVQTRMHGQRVETWINERGEPLLEISMNGIFIAGLEPESAARQYLVEAALNKNETLLDFSRVPVDRAIDAPRDLKYMELVLHGLEGLDLPPVSPGQACRRSQGSVTCRISRGMAAGPEASAAPGQYLRSSVTVPAAHPRIRELARSIAGEAASGEQQVALLLAWLRDNIRPEAIDVFSALDVLEQGRGECQGYSYLFAAFARALDLPTRVVNGLVYSEAFHGLLYHTWVESRIDGQWLAIDPTFFQPTADASHVKLIEGENPADLAPLIGIMGRVRGEILQVDY